MQPMPSNRWEHFSHPAGIGVRGIGASKEEAFEEAATALTAVLTDLNSLEPKNFVKVVCDAPTDELLFVDWLNAVIYEMAARKMLFSKFQVLIDRGRLEGTIWGEPVDTAKHQLAVDVKGATQTELAVQLRQDGKWIAQCVIDL